MNISNIFKNQEYSYTKIVENIKINYVTIKICSLNNMEIR